MGMVIPFTAFGVAVIVLVAWAVIERRAYDKQQMSGGGVRPRKAA
jgi:hypothetical protein